MSTIDPGDARGRIGEQVVFARRARFIRRMNLHHLELFYHVARSGGISRALRHIPYGIQQPAVSIQILALEDHLGVKLFERQPFRLTDEGRELFLFIRPFFGEIDAVERRLQRTQPVLRVAASELVLRDYLPDVMKELKRQHPDLRFRLRSGLQAEIERWLLDSEVDLAIVSLDARPRSGVRSEVLTRLPLVLLVHASSAVKNASDLWAQTPIDEPLICLPPGEAAAKHFARGLRQLEVDWPVAIEASSLDLVTQYVAEGYGVGVSLTAPGLVERRGVRVVPLRGFEPVEIALMWCQSRAPLLAEARAVIARRARELFPAVENKSQPARRRR